MKQSKRIKWLDFGKGFTIFFVVLIHCILITSPHFLPIFTNFISVFIMPLFFAISGFLYKKLNSRTDYSLFVYKKCSSFIIPYFIFLIIIWILNLMNMMPKDLANDHYTLSILLFCNPVNYLWFLYVLFLIFIFIGSVNLIFTRIKINYRFLLFLLLLIILFLSSRIQFGVKEFLCWMLCFYIGYLIKHYYSMVYKIISKSRLFIYLIWMLLFMVLVKIGNNIYAYNDFFNKQDILVKLTSIIAFFTFFITMRHNYMFKYFTKYGRYTLVIYLVHLPIALIIGKILKTFISINIILVLILFGITWVLSLLVCKLSSKCKSINMLFYPRKYINMILFNNNYK